MEYKKENVVKQPEPLTEAVDNSRDEEAKRRHRGHTDSDWYHRYLGGPNSSIHFQETDDANHPITGHIIGRGHFTLDRETALDFAQWIHDTIRDLDDPPLP